MIATMAPKRPTRQKDYHTEPREAFHLPGPLQEAFAKYLDASKPRPYKSEVLRTALEEFLAARGFWPPAQAEE